MNRLVSVLGIFVLLLIAFLFSRDRKAIPWRTVMWGMILQFAFAVLILGVPFLGIPGIFRFVFDALNSLVNQLVAFSDAGSDFVFGNLGKAGSPEGFIFAFRALPPIIFLSSLTAFCYHLGLLQKVVKGIAKVMYKFLGVSGAEALSTAANIFLGQTEAPLVVKPYLNRVTASEMYCIMVGGMATVAAGVLAAYVELLRHRLPDIGGHLLTASVMAAPASILIAKMIYPEKERPETAGLVHLPDERPDTNALEALARGASEGLYMALNVAGMLIAFMAVVAMANAALVQVGEWIHFADWGRALDPFAREGQASQLSFSLILGWVFAPLAWLLGIPWADTALVGKILGEKILLNEFVAYISLAREGVNLSERSLIITSYALCGFANFASIGIQFGGLGTIAPDQKPNLARLGVLAVVGGSLASFLTAAIAGILF